MSNIITMITDKIMESRNSINNTRVGLKRYLSYCSSKNCPFTECERHRSNNVNNESEFNFEGTCDDFRKYMIEEINKTLNKGNNNA